MSTTEPTAKPVSLTPSQTAMLKSCLEREDRTFPVTDWHKGLRGRTIVKKLGDLGLIRPVPAREGNGDVAAGEPPISTYALTETGADVLGVPHLVDTATPADVPQPAVETSANDIVGTTPSASTVQPPRSGSKLRDVVQLLQGPAAVPIEAVIAKTGWLAHTSRAALTGLRKRGYRILTSRGADNHALYRIVGEKG